MLLPFLIKKETIKQGDNQILMDPQKHQKQSSRKKPILHQKFDLYFERFWNGRLDYSEFTALSHTPSFKERQSELRRKIKRIQICTLPTVKSLANNQKKPLLPPKQKNSILSGLNLDDCSNENQNQDQSQQPILAIGDPANEKARESPPNHSPFLKNIMKSPEKSENNEERESQSISNERALEKVELENQGYENLQRNNPKIQNDIRKMDPKRKEPLKIGFSPNKKIQENQSDREFRLGEDLSIQLKQAIKNSQDPDDDNQDEDVEQNYKKTVFSRKADEKNPSNQSLEYHEQSPAETIIQTKRIVSQSLLNGSISSSPFSRNKANEDLKIPQSHDSPVNSAKVQQGAEQDNEQESYSEQQEVEEVIGGNFYNMIQNEQEIYDRNSLSQISQGSKVEQQPERSRELQEQIVRQPEEIPEEKILSLNSLEKAKEMAIESEVKVQKKVQEAASKLQEKEQQIIKEKTVTKGRIINHGKFTVLNRKEGSSVITPVKPHIIDHHGLQLNNLQKMQERQYEVIPDNDLAELRMENNSMKDRMFAMAQQINDLVEINKELLEKQKQTDKNELELSDLKKLHSSLENYYQKKLLDLKTVITVLTAKAVTKKKKKPKKAINAPIPSVVINQKIVQKNSQNQHLYEDRRNKRDDDPDQYEENSEQDSQGEQNSDEGSEEDNQSEQNSDGDHNQYEEDDYQDQQFPGQDEDYQGGW